MTKMTTEEAFVKVLQMHGIEHAFGIIGSAFMPISDIFPDAGITFWDVAHETNGGLIADGYTRATGKMSMVIAQNGPGKISEIGIKAEPIIPNACSIPCICKTFTKASSVVIFVIKLEPL